MKMGRKDGGWSTGRRRKEESGEDVRRKEKRGGEEGVEAKW